MNKNRLWIKLLIAFIIPVLLMVVMAMLWEGKSKRPEGPCDIYAASGTPCITAHSTTRALLASYNGALYQVMRQSDGKTLDIGVVQSNESDPGGYANAASQDSFCSNTICWITKIYDQSGKGNDLLQAPPGTFKGPAKGAFNTLPMADMAPVTINGHKVYGVHIIPGMGFRNNNAKEIAINDEPEGIYYIINGKHYDSGCCFDYGNSSTNGRAVGTGTMETTYYGTATAWGNGNGNGPWIMSDMEAGLFSGYDAKKNDVPSIDSWRFVTAVVNGGGGNKWELRGGNAQEGALTTFYRGVRPGTPNSKDYFPMNKKGGILLGNGGDNGNGSAGTFYEGVMTTGYPTEAATNAVQANIVTAKYDVTTLSLSRIKTFTPNSTQNITEIFTNITGTAIKDVKLSLSVPKDWKVLFNGSLETSKTFAGPIQPGASVSVTFSVSSSSKTGAGYIAGNATWKNLKTELKQTETISQRFRNVFPVKINEIRFSTGDNSTNQFIELYNSSSKEVDISNWTIINTRSEWAPIKLGTIPVNTKLTARGFYLLGLSTSGLVASANKGDKIINVRNLSGFEAGQQINIDDEVKKVAYVGTAASAMTTLFIPVSTGPWLTFPAGTKNLPVTDATGFKIGEKIGIDLGGNYEVATVTSVGKAATQTNLAAPAKTGDIVIKVAASSNMSVGDELIINTGTRKEFVKVKKIIKVVAGSSRGGFIPEGSSIEPGEVELESPLKLNHMLGVDVSDKGTGIGFSPATHFAHKSGDAVQALGSGITLENSLVKNHEVGAPVLNTQITNAGYQGNITPNQWYGIPLSTMAGSVALMSNKNTALVDGVVYGSQQSSSSANGTIASPEIAFLEGDQNGGGCIVVSPTSNRSFRMVDGSNNQENKSVGRYPDGDDTDNNCTDFKIQTTTTLLTVTTPGTTNIKVLDVANFNVGQEIYLGSYKECESTIIEKIGTPGATTIGSVINVGSTVIPVLNTEGFNSGQTIQIDAGTNIEEAVISSIKTVRRRFGIQNNPASDSIKIVSPLTKTHASGVQVTGSGITLSKPLTKMHNKGTQVTPNIPTPGAPNKYTIGSR